ncbi:MAG: glycosyltransferase family 2 protein, partial [Thermoanaerobaculia bacterium]
IMAIRASAFDAAGGFDERFPLYFEENDFLRRVRGEVVYVSAARCQHLYNQSAGLSGEAASLYAQSERMYLRKWGGAFVKRFERRLAAPSLPDAERAIEGDVVIEASPLASFETAAGHFGNDVSDVPDDVWDSYRGDILHLRTVDRRTGRVLRSWAKARIPA